MGIGEVPIDLQAKLLRVLQEGEFDVIGGGTIKVNVRIIAAKMSNYFMVNPPMATCTHPYQRKVVQAQERNATR